MIILSKDRDRAWANAKISGSVQDWETARRFRNWCNNAVKAAKADYIKSELNNNSSDPKRFWNNIKSVLPDQSSGNIDIVNDITGSILPKDQQPQVINDFFVSVGEKLAKNFSQVRPPTDVEQYEEDKLTVDHIRQDEVANLIKSISISKSSGLDSISSRVLKDFLTLAIREITHLYNCILQSGIFPDKWKVATVTPIPKVANASEPNDLRPISLLPVPGKLIEKYITTKIDNFLEGRNFFVNAQNGFRKAKSTSNAVSTFLDDIILNLNASNTSVVAYLDFRKAFDTIDHKILLDKLSASGIGDKLVGLLENYLTNRKQKTKIFNTFSDLKSVNIGVPQGPTMFIVYFNDLPVKLAHSRVIMYADDTVLYCSGAANKSLRKRFQEDLNQVQHWCSCNRLTLNVKKTKIMTFMSDHKRKQYEKFRFYMKGLVVEEVDRYRYLGTIIDNKLSVDPQYTKLAQILGLKLRTFGRIRRYLTTNAALTVYRSTILPIIDYNDHYQLLWNSEKLHRLQKLQNWGLRIVYSNELPTLNESELHSESGILELKNRRILHLLGIMYHRSTKDAYLDRREIHTRQFDKIKFKVMTPVVKKAFKSPNYLGAKLWDMLPRDTQRAGNFAEFKYKIKCEVNAGLFKNVRM